MRLEKAVAPTHQAYGPGRVTGTRELVVTRTLFIMPYRIEERIEILCDSLLDAGRIVSGIAQRLPDTVVEEIDLVKADHGTCEIFRQEPH